MRTLPVVRTRPALRVALSLVLVAVVVGLVLLRPDGSRPDVPSSGPTSPGRVVAVRVEACPDTAPEARIRCTTAEVRLDDGGVVAATAEVDTEPGDAVVVQDRPSGAVVVGHDRRGPSAVLAVLGLLVLVAVARLQGLRAALAVAAVVGTVVWWAVPAALDGRSSTGVGIVVGVVAALGVTLVVRADAGGQVAALAAAVAAAAGAAVVDGIGEVLDVAPVATVGGAVVVAAAAALVATGAVDATWSLDDVAPDAGWRGVARAGRRGARPTVGHVVVATVVLVVATSVLSLGRFVQGTTSVLDVLDGEPLAAPLAWLTAALLVVPLAAPVASSLAAWVAVREAAGPGASDPRRFRSKGERALWEDADR